MNIWTLPEAKTEIEGIRGTEPWIVIVDMLISVGRK